MSRDRVSASPGLVRQGDVLLVPVAELPESVRRVRGRRLVLADGEATGHAHVVADERASLYEHSWRETRYLRVEGVEPVALVHEEHDPLPVLPGVYEVRRQREYAPLRRFRLVRD